MIYVSFDAVKLPSIDDRESKTAALTSNTHHEKPVTGNRHAPHSMDSLDRN